VGCQGWWKKGVSHYKESVPHAGKKDLILSRKKIQTETGMAEDQKGSDRIIK